MNAGDHANEERWRSYYRKTEGRPPRRTLLFALDRAERPGFAIDLGCGGGRDVAEMLWRGWRVLAIDAQASAIEELMRMVPADARDRLQTRVEKFEESALPPSDLVNSSFALPLCPPAAFPRLWWRISRSLRHGGRIACQLYGPKDSWAGRPGLTFHTHEEVKALLTGLHLELFEEEESDSVTPRGTAKHWHIFHIVARRPT